jgi:hypothetical protein
MRGVSLPVAQASACELFSQLTQAFPPGSQSSVAQQLSGIDFSLCAVPDSLRESNILRHPANHTQARCAEKTGEAHSPPSGTSRHHSNLKNRRPLFPRNKNSVVFRVVRDAVKYGFGVRHLFGGQQPR